MKKDDDYYRAFNMNIKNYVHINPMQTSMKISLIYMIIGLLWIATSDSILRLISPNIEVYDFLQTIKGFVYIGVTTIFLYILIINSINKVKKLTKVLFSNYEELNKTYEELKCTRCQGQLKKSLGNIEKMISVLNRSHLF